MVHDRRTLHRIHVNTLNGRSAELPSGVILREFGTANERAWQPGLPRHSGVLHLFDYQGETYYAPLAAGLLKATTPIGPDDELRNRTQAGTARTTAAASSAVRKRRLLY